MSAATTRERHLERKMATIEQRLTVLERFVEMRFCESFRDFSIRSLPAGNASLSKGIQKQSVNQTAKDNIKPKRTAVATEEADDDEQEASLPISPPPRSVADMDVEDEEVPKTSYRTRFGRKSTRLATTALGKKSSERKLGNQSTSSPKVLEEPTSRKVLRIQVSRLGVDSIDPNSSSPSTIKHANAPASPDTSIVKVHYDTADEEAANDHDDGGGGDSYFTFPSEAEDGSEVVIGEETVSLVKNKHVVSDNDDSHSNDEDWDPNTGAGDDSGSDVEYEPQGKKKKSMPNSGGAEKTLPKKRKRKNYNVTSRLDLIPEGVKLQTINNSSLKECPFCHKHWKPEVFDTHVETHVKERHLKCSFCDQRFFVKNQLRNHEKLHQLDKYGVKCRLCEKIFLGNFKRLEHERTCIRKHLEADKHVDPAIIEDVRERSTKVDLKWPDSKEELPEGMKKCVHCKRLIAEDLLMGHLKEFHAQWKCSLCDNTFVLKSGLVRHLNRTHGKNRVTCDLCKKTFESRGAIRAHNEQCRRAHGKRALKRKQQKKVNEGDDEGESETTTPPDSMEEEQEEIEMEAEASLDSTCADTIPPNEPQDRIENVDESVDVDILE